MIAVNQSKLTKRIYLVFITMVLIFSAIPQVDASRVVGGQSFATQNFSHIQNNQQKSNKSTSIFYRNLIAKKILKGLATVLGITWLTNTIGLSEQVANIILIVLIVMIGLALFKVLAIRWNASKQTAMEHSLQNNPTQNIATTANQSASNIQSVYADFSIPIGFDYVSFNEESRDNFICLQRAWEKADLIFMRSMMTDNMFNLMREDLQNCQALGKSRKAKIIQLHAQLFGVKQMAAFYTAAVQFKGLIEEDDNGEQPFNEIWILVKTTNTNGSWLLDGISQLTD